LDSTTALALPDIPRTLLVIGGGYIGLEMGSVYASLGTQVSVVEMTAGLLPGVDRDLVNVLSRRLEQSMAAIMLNTTVVAMQAESNGISVTFEGRAKTPCANTVAPAQVQQPQQVQPQVRQQVFEKVLMAVGRRPNSQGLGLENTRVEINQRGFITVDAQRRTAEPSIYAIGDVAGEPSLARKASQQARMS